MIESLLLTINKPKTMKKQFILFLSLISIITFQSCSNDGPDLAPTPVSEFNYTSDKTHSLNVVYFIPNDVTAPADYHRRLSEILLNVQDFYGKEMERNGYGYKTFGLLKDEVKKRIKLIVITGSKGKSAYPYDGGASAIKLDIENYKASHSTEFTGDHYLVITAATTYDANGEPGGVPFYGTGKYCYALDYADQDIKYLGAGGTLGIRATKWIGGMVHELGHGLNLPHNRQKYSSDSSLGMALMWAGNSTWGISKTFLTAADCAVLNTNQIFNTGNNNNYDAVTASIKEIQASYDATKAAIIVTGKYSSTSLVKDILYFNDPNVNNEGTGVNRDYNAITWTSKSVSTDGFAVEIPIADLEFKADNIAYELKVKLVHQNGSVTETIYSYTFLSGKPVLNFTTRNEIAKTGWSVVSFSSQETSGEATPNGLAANLIDGNAATYWHSQWTGTGAIYPHQFVIDMGSSKTANGLSITQRSGLQRAIKNAELFTSTDGINFTSAGPYTFANSNGPQYFDFTAPKTFRYFKIVGSTAWDGLQFASLAEIGMY
ncbi:discoidin domain-containing protein [Flavobacterium ranwuense]|uniref:Discoidin domain-containing protein n=2 Tax=Flavobacterium ranwuense TaxID=2541725 RepID=A0ABY2DPY0_9FLAO|nr:discoidin domain-containing protein [Flavobacterium ranwuense]